jgi:hypothetical protein
VWFLHALEILEGQVVDGSASLAVEVARRMEAHAAVARGAAARRHVGVEGDDLERHALVVEWWGKGERRGFNGG